jgi:hypothetical protein
LRDISFGQAHRHPSFYGLQRLKNLGEEGLKQTPVVFDVFVLEKIGEHPQ